MDNTQAMTKKERGVLVTVRRWFRLQACRAGLPEAKRGGGYAILDGMVYFRGADLAKFVHIAHRMRPQHRAVRVAYHVLNIQPSAPIYVNGAVLRMNSVPLGNVMTLLGTALRARVEGL